MRAARYRNPLPEGVTLRSVGSVAHLAFASAEIERAYLAMVGKPSPHNNKSDYYIENWIRTLGPTWNALIEYLRYLAVTDPDPHPTVPDLAAAIGVSDQTLRRMIQFWERPEWMDLPEEEWPAREWKRWLGVRGYLPEIWAPAPNARYTFKVLFGDVPHPDQRREWTRILGVVQPQLALGPEPEELAEQAVTLHFGGSTCTSILEGQIDPPICPSILEGQNGGTTASEGSEGPDSGSCTSILEGQNGGSEPSLPPAPPSLRACMRRHAAANQPESKYQTDGPSSTDRRAAAAIALAGLGIPEGRARHLVTLAPLAPDRAQNWVIWLPAVQRASARRGRPIRSVTGFLKWHLAGECDCTEPECDEPEEYAAEQRERRTVPTPTTAAPSPPPRAAAGPAGDPELQPLVDQFRGAVRGNEEAYGHLEGASALRRDDLGLVIRCAGSVNADRLRKWTTRLLQMARAVYPDFPDVRFVGPKGDLP